jgi:hypothetical protein
LDVAWIKSNLDKMAALNRPVKASYEVHESVTVDTLGKASGGQDVLLGSERDVLLCSTSTANSLRFALVLFNVSPSIEQLDNEDHTFSGIMFPIKAKQVLPLESVVIHSVSVRGMLGKMSIWVTNESETPNADGEYRIRLTSRHWTKVYEKEHEASPRMYSVMKFDEPVVLVPGQIRALYIHSTLEGDEAIVYDNSRGLGMVNDRLQPRPRYDDAMITLLSGKAHLSNQPFGQVPVWGWGNAWRDHREFVGRLEYGAVYKLWQPDLNVRYGDKFRKSAMRLLACQRRASSNVPALPDECVYYILNMCRWDWFNDSSAEMKVRRRVLRGRMRRLEMQRREQERLEQERQAEAARVPAAAVAAESDRPASKPRGCGCTKAAASREPPSVDSTQETKESESVEAAAGVADLDVKGNDLPIDADDSEVDDEDEEDEEDEDEALGDVDDEEEEGGDGDDGDDNEDEDGSDESQWERANGYRADGTIFTIHDESSDDEDESVADRGGGGGGSNNNNNNNNEAVRRNWMDGIRVLRSFANPRGNA